MNSYICPFCYEGEMHRETRHVEYSYKGHTLLIAQPGEYCSHCNEAILEPEDLKSNRLDLQTHKAKVDKILGPVEVKKIRKSLKFTQKEAGEIFGGGHNAFSRYETGEVPIPKATSILLAVLHRHPDLKDEIIATDFV